MNTNIVQNTEIRNPEPKTKRIKWLQIGILSLVSLLVICSLIFGYFYYFLHTARSKASTKVEFVVTQGEGVKVISTNLEKQGIIRQDIAFMIYLKVSGLSGSIQAGNYSLAPNMTPLTVADILSKGKVESARITIPEGWTIDQIGSYLDKQGIVKKSDLIAATKKNYDYDFLKGRPAGANLEGFLFPDTYQLSVTANADDIVKMMLDNFGKKLTPDIRAAISNSSLDLYQTVTLASVVERESSKPEQRKVIAGIFLGRLADGMRLQSDVTVEYALGNTGEKLTAADLELDSPYNTYLIDGLPKGPISNPGIDSINAVLYPVTTEYRFFLTVGDNIYYAKTLEEHNQNIAKYQK